MNERTIMLTVLSGGPLLGLLLGATLDTTMKPAPEPHWRQLRAVAAPSHVSPPDVSPWQFVDAGAQDLSPHWAEDRMPTWKRRAMERARAAATYIQSAYYDYDPEPVLDASTEPREMAYEETAAPFEPRNEAADAAGEPDRAAAGRARDTATALAPPVVISPVYDAKPVAISVTAGL